MRKGMKLLVSFIIICFVTLCFCGGVSMARSLESPVPERCYTSVVIQSGDTLWDLESRYNTGGHLSKEAYIEELRTMNHLKSDTIHAGGYLMVLYFR